MIEIQKKVSEINCSIIQKLEEKGVSFFVNGISQAFKVKNDPFYTFLSHEGNEFNITDQYDLQVFHKSINISFDRNKTVERGDVRGYSYSASLQMHIISKFYNTCDFFVNELVNTSNIVLQSISDDTYSNSRSALGSIDFNHGLFYTVINYMVKDVILNLNCNCNDFEFL